VGVDKGNGDGARNQEQGTRDGRAGIACLGDCLFACGVRTVIVTDSSACLPAEVIARYGIRVVPLALVIDGETVPDGALSAEELFALIDGSDRPPKSAAPAPGSSRRRFERNWRLGRRRSCA
jgi:hypothetical protein